MPAKKFNDILADLMDRSPLTQREMAVQLGYPVPNIISMFRTGATKVPITKVAPLAKILDADPVWLLRRALEEYAPGVWEAFEATAGARVSVNEVEIVAALRAATGDTNPRLIGGAAQVKLEELGKALMS